MNVPDMQGDQSWRTQAFRQKVIAQIEDAVLKSGNPTTKTSIEMENHVFTKAKNKEEYLGLVARLIIHVREMNSKKERIGGPGMGGPSVGGMVQGIGMQGQPGVPDPINALQNLARQGSTASGILPGGPQMQMAGNQQPHPAMNQGMIRGHHPGMNPGMATISGGQMLTFSSSGGAIPTQQQMGVQPSQMMMNPTNNSMQESMPSSMQLQFQKMRAQQGMRPTGPMMSNQQFAVSNQPMQENILATQAQQLNSTGMPRQPNQPSFLGPNSNNMQGSNQGLGPTMPMVMSPAGQHLQSTLPSPSGQMLPSPASNVSQMSVRGPSNVGPIASPGSMLNTPGGPSPVRPSSDNQAYMEKLRSLQKYIEPLRRMISRIDKEEDTNKNLNRMRNLLNSLCNPSPCLTMETLMKCETVLEKMDLKVIPGDMALTGLSPAQVPTLPGIKAQEQNMCQLLLDAVAHHIKYPTFNHTLQRTFGPALTALHGPRLRPPSLLQDPNPNPEDKDEIPDLVQGEIARLDQRFKVSLDQIQHTSSRTIHLICQLDDRNLPCVPPISISLPEGYPDTAPKFDISEAQYNATPFLQKIRQCFNLQLETLSNRYSLTSLLDTWEMSVRQACSPNPLPAEPAMLLGC